MVTNLAAILEDLLNRKSCPGGIYKVVDILKKAIDCFTSSDKRIS